MNASHQGRNPCSLVVLHNTQGGLMDVLVTDATGNTLGFLPVTEADIEYDIVGPTQLRVKTYNFRTGDPAHGPLEDV